MAKIRELLLGPVIADESARVDESVDRLNELVREQQEAITALHAKIRELEDRQRAGMERFRVRLLGMVEAVLADEDDVRSRLKKNDALLFELNSEKENDGE